MIRLKTAILVSVLSLATVGCVAHGRATGGAVVSADLILVELHPGVWVIEDYDEPVFYADGYFWLHRDDGWYRSSDHTSGWVQWRAAPRQIVSIERPRQYVHYRAAAGHRVRRGPNGPISVRDRGDVREERREDQQERREEKREEQQEKREDKLEAREERREEQQDRREDKVEAREEKREDQAEKREDQHHDKAKPRKK